ncbi:MAG: translation initiation factor IF-1 [Bryobacteraceae bacterium]
MPGDREPVRAVVVEILPSLAYRLEVEGSRAEVIAHPAGAAGKNYVRLRLRDVVLVELSAEDPGRGRVVRVLQS